MTHTTHRTHRTHPDVWEMAQAAASRARDEQRPLRVHSIGAGVQSTAMLLMSLERILPLADLGIFADTGNEPTAVYAHLAWLEAFCARAEYPLLILPPRDIAGDILDAIDNDAIPTGHIGQPPFFVKGPRDTKRKTYIYDEQDGQSEEVVVEEFTGPGRLWRKCSEEYKILPIRRVIRSLVGSRGTAENWLGISLDEKRRMRPSDVKWISNHYPLVEARLTRHDCLLWLAARGYPTPPKSSCLICPFHSDAYWRDLKATAPDDFARTEKFDVELREGHLPGVHGQAYLHKSCQPLATIDFTTPHDKVGQLALPLWGATTGECQGVCFT